MNKNILKALIIGVFLLFLILYFFGSNMFQSDITLKRNLTISQIEKFENDIKNGKEIDLNDYIIKDKSYDNIITNTNNKISNAIESGFKKLFKYLLKNINV